MSSSTTATWLKRAILAPNSVWQGFTMTAHVPSLGISDAHYSFSAQWHDRIGRKMVKLLAKGHMSKPYLVRQQVFLVLCTCVAEEFPNLSSKPKSGSNAVSIWYSPPQTPLTRDVG